MYRLSILFAMLAAASPAWAATPINERRPLDLDGEISVENVNGHIQVRAWDRPEVTITGSLGKGAERLAISGDQRHLVVEVKYPDNGWNGRNIEPTRLELMVPLRASLEVDSVAAGVDVQGVAGDRLSVDAVSGNVVVAAAPREADVETVSGDQNVTVNSGEVSVESVSGDIILRGRLNGEVSAQTVSGNLQLDTNNERLRELSVETVSGNAQARTGLAGNGKISLTTVSGDLRLTTPKNLSARVSGESFSGDLRAPGAEIVRPKYGPGASFTTRYGNGDGEIRLESFSGEAELVLE